MKASPATTLFGVFLITHNVQLSVQFAGRHSHQENLIDPLVMLSRGLEIRFLLVADSSRTQALSLSIVRHRLQVGRGSFTVALSRLPLMYRTVRSRIYSNVR